MARTLRSLVNWIIQYCPDCCLHLAGHTTWEVGGKMGGTLAALCHGHLVWSGAACFGLGFLLGSSATLWPLLSAG